MTQINIFKIPLSNSFNNFLGIAIRNERMKDRFYLLIKL